MDTLQTALKRQLDDSHPARALVARQNRQAAASCDSLAQDITAGESFLEALNKVTMVAWSCGNGACQMREFPSEEETHA